MAVYQDMKDSGIEWLGAVPKHWQIQRLQNHLIEISENNNPIQTTQVLSLTNKLGVVPYEEKGNQGNKAKTDYSAYKLAYPDSIVANSMNILIGSVGLSSYFGCVSPVYYVFKSRNNSNIKFFNYIFSTCSFQKELRKYANGILEIRLRVSAANILKQKVAIPPEHEQAIIVDFLDSTCNQINSIIEATKNNIQEYQCLKSSIIFESVTKGLNCNAELVDSHYAWIGTVPTHWRVSKINNFVTIRSGITLGKQYPENIELIEMPYLRVANVKANHFALDDVATIRVTKAEAKKYALHPGELLMTEGGDRDKLGRGTIWHGEIPDCLHQNHIFAVTVNENIMLTEFLAYLTASRVGREYFDLTAKKTTNLASTNSTTVLQFEVPVPPLEEQKAIVAELNDKCAQIDSIIQEKESLISDLEAYKKSLIYEVVTGKRRVI